MAAFAEKCLKNLNLEGRETITERYALITENSSSQFKKILVFSARLHGLLGNPIDPNAGCWNAKALHVLSRTWQGYLTVPSDPAEEACGMGRPQQNAV